ncbi:MAG: protein kinase [Myxococcaceae bacterium]|nr:protein kinase [Myxococcaceae bacterium]MCI0672837.1 protein kinase [Myxococcaceae bacterium]
MLRAPSVMRCAICSNEHPLAEACAVGAAQDATGPTVLSPRTAREQGEQRDLSGRHVGELLLVRRLGQGGMGSVYLAQDASGRARAVKVLHPALAADPGLLKRFRAEAEAASRIDHPSIVAMEDLGFEPPDLHFLVMEYLMGTPLSAQLHGQPLPVPRVRALLEQVLSGLEAAHVRGVVHRDLKPDNLFLLPAEEGAAERLKILDFGVAKVLDAGVRLGQTVAGTLIGTPEYMAPEQVKGAEVDGRADLYALGVIAYELLTGVLPFTGPTLIAVLMAHQQEAPVAPAERNPDVPVALSDIILRALAKRPEDRFPSAGAFRDALQEALGRRGGAGHTSLPAEQTFVPPAPAAPQTARVERVSSPVPKGEVASSGTLVFGGGLAGGNALLADEWRALAAVLPTELPPAPSRPPPPLSTPAPSSPRQLFTVKLSLPGQPPRTLPCMQLTRGGGLLLADEGTSLPLRTRVPAVLQLPLGESPVVMEVVGRVDAGQGREWGLPEGPWMQLVEVRPEARAQLETFARGETPLPLAAARIADAPHVDRMLEPLGPSAGSDPYRLLGLAFDAPFDRVRARVRELQQTLVGVQDRKLSMRQRDEAEAAAERLSRAAAVLSLPSARLRHDAERANWAGVARCIAAGVTASELTEVRAVFLKRHRGAEARSRIHQATAASWEARGDAAQALTEYERALDADPLQLELHRRYWPLRQGRAPARKRP